MEAGKTEQDRRERTDNLRRAVEDLREARKKPGGDVRSGIRSAMSQLRDASNAPAPTREELDTYRDRVVSGTASVLEAVEKEARNCREQLQARGEKSSKGDGEKQSAPKPSGAELGGASGGPKSSGSN